MVAVSGTTAERVRADGDADDEVAQDRRQPHEPADDDHHDGGREQDEDQLQRLRHRAVERDRDARTARRTVGLKSVGKSGGRAPERGASRHGAMRAGLISNVAHAAPIRPRAGRAARGPRLYSSDVR